MLTYVSGLGPQLAQNIVDYRRKNGLFNSREELKNVPRLGPKAYEQAAGFLRIPESKNPLDNSAVHPESYALVAQMAKDLHTEIDSLIRNQELIKQIDLHAYLTEDIGLPTLTDIVAELEKPGRDPRKHVQVLEFDANIRRIEDLKIGMELPGIVTNITNFGAFVDVGIKENGLIHISKMADRFISNPAEVVSLHQHVQVKVLDVDLQRNRIQLQLIHKK